MLILTCFVGRIPRRLAARLMISSLMPSDGSKYLHELLVNALHHLSPYFDNCAWHICYLVTLFQFVPLFPLSIVMTIRTNIIIISLPFLVIVIVVSAVGTTVILTKATFTDYFASAITPSATRSPSASPCCHVH